METLLQADRELLLFFNQMYSPLWDNFFWVFTSIPVWIPLYLAIIFVFFKRLELRGVWALLAVVLVIVLCDQISSSFFKEFFERLRPSHEPTLEGIVRLVNDKKGGRFGFVSSHAANSFGLAMFTALLFRKWYFSVFIFLWALVNSYSRIYMGLHYPGDILGGLILGVLCGVFVYWMYKRFSFRYIYGGIRQKKPYGNEVWIPVTVLVTSVFVVFISSGLLLKLM